VQRQPSLRIRRKGTKRHRERLFDLGRDSITFGVAEPIGGWIADTLIRRGWNETRIRKGIVTIAFATGLLLLPAMRASSTSTAFGLLIGAALVGLATGNLLTILQSCAPADKVGIWTGAENFAGNLSGIVAPLAVGMLITHTGSYVPGFSVASFVLLLGLLVRSRRIELRAQPRMKYCQNEPS